MQPANNQMQSPLISKFSRETRDLIYLELWNLACGGFRQHIVWHGSPTKKRHFCHWPCSMPPWSPEDELQREIAMMKEKNETVGTKHTRRLQSPWLNHWPCGEDVVAKTGAASAIERIPTTCGGPCWSEVPRASQDTKARFSSYISMLLVCKMISFECLESIYRSTTFVFTDAVTYQAFVGFCRPPPVLRGPEARQPQQPPAFFKHACKLEISLIGNFASSFPCAPLADMEDPIVGPVHDAFDFHWLKLNRFDHLTDLKIWVNSRGTTTWSDPNLRPVRTPLLVDLNIEALREAFRGLEHTRSVAFSAALHHDVKTRDGSEDGFVDNVAPPNVHLWKRGTGDYYHPRIGPIRPGGFGDGVLISSRERKVGEETKSRSIDHVHVKKIP